MKAKIVDKKLVILGETQDDAKALEAWADEHYDYTLDGERLTLVFYECRQKQVTVKHLQEQAI